MGRTSVLPAGSRELARVPVIEVNRSRLITAAIDALADGGYADLTVAAVIDRARVSRKTFYEVFTNRHDCFEAVVAHVSARALAAMSASCTPDVEWLEATRLGLGALLALIDEDPALARIWFIEAPAGHSAVLHQRARAMSAMTDAVHLGGSDASEPRRPSRIVAEATVGGISHIIHTRLISASKEPFTDLTGSFMYLITLPYLGQARARAELRRAPAHVSRQSPRVQRSRLDNALRETKMRLTYRTIRALSAVSDRPGTSNLEVSIECGIKDQGQISKLLSRLEGLGLIENRGRGPALGLPNAWHITSRGTELVGATRASMALGERREERGARDAVGH